MSRTQILNHKGTKIFQMNFSNIKNVNEISSIINESVKHIRSQPFGTVYTLTDITNMHFSTEIRDLFQEFIKGNKPYVKAGAVVGLSGLQQLIYNGLMKVTGRDIKSFSDIEQAKEWLIDRN